MQIKLLSGTAYLEDEMVKAYIYMYLGNEGSVRLVTTLGKVFCFGSLQFEALAMKDFAP